MNSYKLIKKYPNCQWELGKIIKSSIGWHGLYQDLEKGLYTEFWEKIIEKPVEKNYEILSYIVSLITYTKVGSDIFQGNNSQIKSDRYLNKYGEIHSIKRLSDGKVFIIGDDIHHNRSTSDSGKITKMVIGGPHGICVNAFIVYYGDHFWNGISVLEHTKKPLFTTEDKVDIYKGDGFYWVDLVDYSIMHSTCDAKIDADKYNFSTRKAASDWISRNKPLFKTSDGIDIYKGDRYWFTPTLVTETSCISENTALRSSCDDKYIRFTTKLLAQQYIDSKRIKIEDGYLYDCKDLTAYGVCVKSSWQVINTYDFNFINRRLNSTGNHWKFFTTGETRNEYIEYNKPMYSKKQILDIIDRDGDEYSDGECIDDLFKLIK